MTPSQFSVALDRWGANLANWPEDQRNASETLLKHSAEARAMLAEIARMEAFIQTNDPAQAMGDDALMRVMNSVMAALPKAEPAGRSTLAALRDWLGMAGMGSEWLPRFAVSLSTAAVLGLMVADRLSVHTTQQLSPIEALAMSNTYLPMDLR